MKIGSLCTGYGGLDMAVETYFNAEMVWCAENDKYASKVIQERFNKTNLGDIKQIDCLTNFIPKNLCLELNFYV